MTTATDDRWKAAMGAALCLAAVYAANVLYRKLVEDVGLAAVGLLGEGLQPVDQFLVLLLFSICFAAGVLLHPGEGV
ncbi:MAG: hypothetical protein ABEJ74_02320 [Haloferacaceae archaeon]